MTQEYRELVFSIIDGRPEQEITMHLFQISRHVRALEIFRYLVREKITGLNFLFEIRGTHKGSVLNFMGATVKKLDHDIAKRPIIVGRHWA